MKIRREKIAAAGLLAANVLILNNYRDMDDDKAVGKRTTVVIFGRKVMGMAYLLLSYPDLEQACNKHRCRPQSGTGNNCTQSPDVQSDAPVYLGH